MFIEVFRAELSRDTADASALIDVDLPVEQVLPFIVQMISSQLTSDFGVRVYRVSVGEAERFPTLAQEYYDAGPGLLRSQLVRYLERCVQRGELVVEDLELAADQLIRLAGTTIQDRTIFLGRESVDRDMLRRVNRGAVAMFMAAYGVGNRAADQPG